MKEIIAGVAFATVFGIGNLGFAAGHNAYEDIPSDSWVYPSLMQLIKNDVIQGNMDGTLNGHKVITRQEAAIAVANAGTKAAKGNEQMRQEILRLQEEFKDELTSMKQRDRIEKIANSSQNEKINIWGFVRADYSHQNIKGNYVSNSNSSIHPFIFLDYQLAEGWKAHMVHETMKPYRQDDINGSSDGDWNNEYVWLDGRLGNIAVNFGRKWINSPYAKTIGASENGLWMDYAIPNKTNISLFLLKPTDNSLKTTTLYGMALKYTPYAGTNINLLLGANTNAEAVQQSLGEKISRWGELGFDTQLGSDWRFTAAYDRSNAAKDNVNAVVKLEYKGTDLKVKGSYGLFARFDRIAPFGALSADDEWGSLPKNSQGYGIGVDYMLAKDIRWHTAYYWHNAVADGTIKGITVKAGDSRRLFTSRVDFYF